MTSNHIFEEIYSNEILAHANVAYAEYSEVINLHDCLKLICNNDNRYNNIEVLVQTRDIYGNICKKFDNNNKDSDENNLIVSSWLSSTSQSNILNLIVKKSSHVGVYSILIPYIEDTTNQYIHIAIRNEEILYSPFSIDLYKSKSIENIDINEILPPLVEPIIPNQLQQGKISKQFSHQSTNGGNENDLKIKLNKLKLEVITRKRSEEALRKEQIRIQQEKERKQLLKNIKRTGGGFIIQYSKDI
jgi:hypothetical protein